MGFAQSEPFFSGVLQPPQQQSVSIRDDLTVPLLASAWCSGALIGSAAAALLLLAVVFLTPREPATALPLPPTDVDDGSVCYTPGCLATADYFRDMLNPLVEPCQNFQQHVCGRFRGPLDSFVGTEFLLIYTDLIATSLLYTLAPAAGARYKAASLLRECTDIYGSEVPRHEELRTFMQHIGLSLTIIESTSANVLLALHVNLAYTYGLSALLKIRPRTPQFLVIELKSDVLETALPRQRDSTYVAALASLAGVRPSTSMVAQRDALYAAVKAAIAHAKATHQPLAPASPLARLVKRVSEISFAGVSANAFGEAIEANTPYTRNATVFAAPVLKAVLESLWRAMSSADLHLWTSWDVLDQVAPFVEPAFARARWSSVDRFAFACLGMVAHVMEPALAALIRLPKVTNEARGQVAAMTDSIAACLKERREWLAPFATPPRLVVGFPTYADSIESLDVFYSSFPTPRRLRFFADWLSAVAAWRRSVSPAEVHFDPLDSDIEVTADGAVLVPAALLTAPFFEPDGAVASNVGGLGHLIARSLARRYITPGAHLPAECDAAMGSWREGVLENLLAYGCIRPAMRALNASPRLPRFGALSPEKMMYTAACLKDCTRRDGQAGGCNIQAEHLKVFEEAFHCNSGKKILCPLA